MSLLAHLAAAWALLGTAQASAAAASRAPSTAFRRLPGGVALVRGSQVGPGVRQSGPEVGRPSVEGRPSAEGLHTCTASDELARVVLSGIEACHTATLATPACERTLLLMDEAQAAVRSAPSS